MSYPVAPPGGTVTARVQVSASKANASGTRVSLSGAGVSISPGSQSLGTVTASGMGALATVKIPATAKHGVITIVATVTANKAASTSARATVVVTAPENITPPPGLGPGSPGSSGGSAPGGGYSPFSLPPSQVALPPVASPQIAPDAQPILSMAALRAGAEPTFEATNLAALQAGWLAGLVTSVALLLARLQLLHRRRGSARQARHVLWLPFRTRLPDGMKLPPGVKLPKGKKLTAARLRALPPQPAQSVRPAKRERAVRVVWVPLRAPRIARS